MNQVFVPAKDIRINMIYSYSKLNQSFQKISTQQTSLSYIRPITCKRILDILRKMKNLKTFKPKMKQYYLNDLSNPIF